MAKSPEKSNSGKSNKSERTRKGILDAFVELMYEKKWDRITVKELCIKCDITRSTFYQYYSDIYDLMETMENDLLNEIAEKYNKVIHAKHSKIPNQLFVEKFDYSPPGVFTVWFEFVEKNKKAVFALLDRKNGDSYFVKRLKQLMTICLNKAMDSDGHPYDELRSHYTQLLMEMHIHAAQIWIDSGGDDPISIDEIVHLLNSTRVGACYIGFKKRTDPKYNEKMKHKDEK